MRFALDVPLEDLAEAFLSEMHQSDVIDFVCQIDLRIAEVEFTEPLIKRLVSSIRGDMSADEFAALIAELGSQP